MWIIETSGSLPIRRADSSGSIYVPIGIDALADFYAGSTAYDSSKPHLSYRYVRSVSVTKPGEVFDSHLA